MTDYIHANSEGRIDGWTFDAKYAIGFEQVELPEGFEVGRMTDWLYRDGEWQYDPLPDPDPDPQPTLEGRVTTIEGEMNALLGLNTTNETEATDAE